MSRVIEELKDEYRSKLKKTVCWTPQEKYLGRGGQSVALSPAGVYLESEETGFAVFVNHERSQLKNADLALTLFNLYLDETIK